MSVDNSWFYEADGNRTGPVSLQVIRSLSRKGVITRTTLVCDGAEDDWVPFSDVESRVKPTVPSGKQSPASDAALSPPAMSRHTSVPVFAPEPDHSTDSKLSVSGLYYRPGVTGFGEAISVCLSKYFTFDGRANRPEFWYFNLFGVLVNLGIMGIMGVAIAAMPATSIAAMLPFAVLIFQLALSIPMLSVSIRRLHDTDKSGWWYLIALVPIVGAIALLVFFVQRGTIPANRYG